MATTYYASLTGNASVAGTSSGAPTTFAHAIAQMVAGDELQLRGGVYSSQTIADRTWSGAGIKIRNFGTEAVDLPINKTNNSGVTFEAFGGTAALKVKTGTVDNNEKITYRNAYVIGTQPNGHVVTGTSRRRFMTYDGVRFGGSGADFGGSTEKNVMYYPRGGPGPSDITFRASIWDTWDSADGCLIHDVTRLKIEDCIARNFQRVSSTSNHPDWFEITGGCDDIQIRRNWMYNADRGILILPNQKTTPVAGQNTNVVIESNVFEQNGSDFCLRFFNCPGAKVAGNTFWGSTEGATDNLDIRYLQNAGAPASQGSTNVILVNNIARSMTVADGVTFVAERNNRIRNPTIFKPDGTTSSYTLHSTSKKGVTMSFVAPYPANPPNYKLQAGTEGVGQGLLGTVPGTSYVVPTYDRNNATRSSPYDIGGIESDPLGGAPAPQSIFPVGIPSVVDVGEPTISQGSPGPTPQTISPTGIASHRDVGEPTLIVVAPAPTPDETTQVETVRVVAPTARAHFGWPYRLGRHVEDGSSEELAASAAVIASTPRGHRDDDPDFGATPLVFDQRPLDGARLAAELERSDPRLAGLEADEISEIAEKVATVRVDRGERNG